MSRLHPDDTCKLKDALLADSKLQDAGLRGAVEWIFHDKNVSFSGDLEFPPVCFFISPDTYQQEQQAFRISNQAADILNVFGDRIRQLCDQTNINVTPDTQVSCEWIAAGLPNSLQFLEQFCIYDKKSHEYRSLRPQTALAALKHEIPYSPGQGPDDAAQRRLHDTYPFKSHSYAAFTRLDTMALDPQNADSVACTKECDAKHFDYSAFQIDFIDAWGKMQMAALQMLLESYEDKLTSLNIQMPTWEMRNMFNNDLNRTYTRAPNPLAQVHQGKG